MERSMFPEEWPEGCPPADAADAGGVYFLLVGSDPPNPEGEYADGRSKCEKKGGVYCLDCGCCGISVFPNVHDARSQYHFNLKWTSRKLARSIWKYVSRATLEASHGAVRVIGGQVDTHTNWWPRKELDVRSRCALFGDCVPTEV